MRRILSIILSVFLLVSCSSNNSPEIMKIEIEDSSIKEVRFSNNSNGLTFDMDEEWLKFLDIMEAFEYTIIDVEESKITINESGDPFNVTLILESGIQKFIIRENEIITYNLENINDDISKSQILISSHDDVKELYKELSDIDFPEGSVLFKKPVIYIYPEEKIKVEISLESECKMIRSYPLYEDGWQVVVDADGVIKKDGKKFSYLYWEGEIDYDESFDDGFIVKREETIHFLENKLEYLGLNFRERNDFITYWLPELEKSKYNKIRFLVKEYDELVKMNVEPKPDTLIRIFMVFDALEENEIIKEQTLIPVNRQGYTIVEWGGGEIE